MYFPVLFFVRISQVLAVKTASEMTYTVSGGALNSTQIEPKFAASTALAINRYLPSAPVRQSSAAGRVNTEIRGGPTQTCRRVNSNKE